MWICTSTHNVLHNYKILLSGFRGVALTRKTGLTDWLSDWLTDRLNDWLTEVSKTLYPPKLVAWGIINLISMHSMTDIHLGLFQQEYVSCDNYLLCILILTFTYSNIFSPVISMLSICLVTSLSFDMTDGTNSSTLLMKPGSTSTNWYVLNICIQQWPSLYGGNTADTPLNI